MAERQVLEHGERRVGLFTSDHNTPLGWFTVDDFHVYNFGGHRNHQDRSRRLAEIHEVGSILDFFAIDVNWPHEELQRFGLLDALQIVDEYCAISNPDGRVIGLHSSSPGASVRWFYQEARTEYGKRLVSSVASVHEVYRLVRVDGTIEGGNWPLRMSDPLPDHTLYRRLKDSTPCRRVLTAAAVGIVTRPQYNRLAIDHGCEPVTARRLSKDATQAKSMLSGIDPHVDRSDEDWGLSGAANWVSQHRMYNYISSFVRRHPELYQGNMLWMPSYYGSHPRDEHPQ